MVSCSKTGKQSQVNSGRTRSLAFVLAAIRLSSRNPNFNIRPEMQIKAKLSEFLDKNFNTLYCGYSSAKNV